MTGKTVTPLENNSKTVGQIPFGREPLANNSKFQELRKLVKNLIFFVGKDYNYLNDAHYREIVGKDDLLAEYEIIIDNIFTIVHEIKCMDFAGVKKPALYKIFEIIENDCWENSNDKNRLAKQLVLFSFMSPITKIKSACERYANEYIPKLNW